jgi:hypothetical protein
MELPFKLYKDHKSKTIWTWKYRCLKETDEFIEELYNRYIVATHCELCDNQFKSSQDRQMEHNHETGEFRNIVCRSCNQKKYDVKIQSNNISGYKGIYKNKCKRYNQGFVWRFVVFINGKPKFIKSSTDLNKLVVFADKWKIENDYHS